MVLLPRDSRITSGLTTFFVVVFPDCFPIASRSLPDRFPIAILRFCAGAWGKARGNSGGRPVNEGGAASRRGRGLLGDDREWGGRNRD